MPDTSSNASDSMVANVTATMPAAATTPASFNGDQQLLAASLGLATALMFVALMRGSHKLYTMVKQRTYDGVFDPVTINRTIMLLALSGLCLRAAAEAYTLWSWQPGCSMSSSCLELYARAVMTKRWLDLASYGFAISWIILDIIGEPNIELQLRARPLPDNPFKRWPRLIRPGVIVLLSFVCAGAVVWLH